MRQGTWQWLAILLLAVFYAGLAVQTFGRNAHNLERARRAEARAAKAESFTEDQRVALWICWGDQRMFERGVDECNEMCEVFLTAQEREVTAARTSEP